MALTERKATVTMMYLADDMTETELAECAKEQREAASQQTDTES